jgi:signal transduction histidine kinase
VNMPHMDGFETAALIREHPSSEHTPIIFITAYGDDAFALRGYSLGAVDYILTPLDPQVLRTKVAVFVELFRKNEQTKRQAASLEAHAARLQRLASASVRIHAARALDDLLEAVLDSSAALVGARQVAVSMLAPVGTPFARSAGLPGGLHERRRPSRTRLPELEPREVGNGATRPRRRTRAETESLPQGRRGEAAAQLLPITGWLAVPLTTTDRSPLGWLQLSDKEAGEFDEEDELLLVQLAQMASIAAENIFYSEAREANRIKDQFLATLSHELRSPLQSILSWACLLREEGVEGPMIERGLEVIERNARMQARLIEDLLDVSRIITGKLVLERRSMRVEETIRTAAEDMRVAAEEKGLELVIEAPCPDVLVSCDPHRLRQVMENLISNGIKFTPAGGRVVIQTERRENALEIRVRDTGRGIAPSFLPHLFEPFRQADSGSTRPHAGLGIGLAIVQHLMDLQGGSVRAESAGEGLGATFLLSFPIVSNEARSASERPVGEQGVEPRLHGLRILVVDDEADSRASVELALKQCGAVVTAVESVANALDALEREPIDMLLSDLAMPGEDGFSLVRRVRARESEKNSRLPAVALSAYVRAEERAQAENAGFDLHLAKPIEPLALARALDGLLRSAKKPRAVS